jgi:GlcNAc-P-P-Und epimerase
MEMQYPFSPGGESIVILGGAGFIGTRLAGLLEEHGKPFRIGDIVRSETSSCDRWTSCDVRDAESVRETIRGADLIINLAAEHRDDVRPLSRYYATNVDGAKQVCQIARETGIAKIIFTSSVAVYGFHEFPADENCSFAPFNEYGKTKLEAEGVYRAWAGEDPARTLVIVRPTVVFGEGNRGNVYNLLHQIASGKFLMVGSGRNRKSMAYVGNLAAFLIHTLSLGPGVHIFNYADGPDMSTGELVEYIQDCLCIEKKRMQVPMAVALAGGHLLDVLARASNRTFPVSAIRVRKFCESTQFRADRLSPSGFVPPYSLKEALTRTIRHEFLAK